MNIAHYIVLLRLNQPIGIWLLFFPAAWAVALVADAADVGRLMLLMLVGAAVTRAAGCILNDLADRRLDARVARTRNRPLASGAVPLRRAYLLLCVLLLAALALALSLPLRVFYLALPAVAMIAAYPWMKRITWWPQLFLGITFNLGAFFGWLASGSPLVWPVWTLYAAAVFWTLGYDTIYAVQDMDDDARIGIRSSALRLGVPRIRMFVAVCYGMMLALLTLTALGMALGIVFYLALLAVAAHAIRQVRQLPCSPSLAGSLFRSNQWLGLFVLMGLLAVRFM